MNATAFDSRDDRAAAQSFSFTPCMDQGKMEVGKGMELNDGEILTLSR